MYGGSQIAISRCVIITIENQTNQVQTYSDRCTGAPIWRPYQSNVGAGRRERQPRFLSFLCFPVFLSFFVLARNMYHLQPNLCTNVIHYILFGL